MAVSECGMRAHGLSPWSTQGSPATTGVVARRDFGVDRRTAAVRRGSQGAAIAAISTFTSRGSLATSTVARAGGAVLK